MGDAHTNLINKAAITVTPRIIDFVTAFPRNFQALQEVLGISEPIKKAAGTSIKQKKAAGSLASNTGIGEGDLIPRSKYTVTENTIGELTLEKFSKEVSLEAIMEYGYDAACGMTDEEFIIDLQSKVTDKFYTTLTTGSATGTAASMKAAIAKSIGHVKNEFRKLHRSVTGVAVFVNMLDFYDYLGGADITVQNAFGMTYVQNFMGADVIVLCTNDEVATNKVYATPVNNIKTVYVDPSDEAFTKAGIEYTTDGVTNMVGVNIKADYDRATSVTYAVMGVTMYPEYSDAIARITVSAGE